MPQLATLFYVKEIKNLWYIKILSNVDDVGLYCISAGKEIFAHFPHISMQRPLLFICFVKKGTKISEILWPKVWQGNNILWLITAHFLEISWWSISLCGFREKRYNQCTFLYLENNLVHCFYSTDLGIPTESGSGQEIGYNWKIQKFCKILHLQN